MENISKPTVPELDAILGQRSPVLGDGFIRVIDYMGTDESIVQAARVSYGSGTKTTSSDEQLIRFMMRHGHTSPFEMCKLKLHVRVPMDVWRQWIRHRTANVNEYSTRYSEAIDSQHEVQPDEWRLQSSTNRQGSGETLGDWETITQRTKGEISGRCDIHESPGHYLTKHLEEFQYHARQVYRDRLLLGVAREQARQDLPLSTYTEAYWAIDLHNLLHFLSKRMPPDAQHEIRQYANVIADIVAKWVPMTWRAFQDYKLNAMTLSATEVEAIRAVLADGNQPYWNCTPDGMSKGETEEFRQKLKRLGARTV